MKITKKCKSTQYKINNQLDKRRNKRRSSAGLFNTSSAGAVTSLILVIALSFLFSVFFNLSGLNGVTNTYATSSTITLSVSDNISVDVLPTSPTAFASNTSTITVATDHVSGYTLTIAASNDSDNGALTGTNDTIPTINATCRNNATSITQANFSSRSECNDMWGYSPSYYNSTANTAYYPSPTTTGDTLDVTSAANAVAKSYTISIGTKVTENTTADNYTKTFIISAVGNLVPYTITYNSGVVSGMPSDVNSSTDSSTITLSSAEPTADGYNFLGWCTVAPTRTDGTDACTGGTSYSPGDTYSLSSGTALNLYAMWEEAVTYYSLAITMNSYVYSISFQSDTYGTQTVYGKAGGATSETIYLVGGETYTVDFSYSQAVFFNNTWGSNIDYTQTGLYDYSIVISGDSTLVANPYPSGGGGSGN